jgi:ABC-type multidrug transport system ATPase subunit
MRAQLRAAALGPLRSADLELTPGRYVVLGGEREPQIALIAVLTGAEQTKSGLALLDGHSPSATPEVRRKVAALLGEEALPPAKTVLDSVTKALAARGGNASVAAGLLADAGLEPLAKVAPDRLAPRETRSVALALALAHDTAELCALHEPLTTLLAANFVLARLDEHTARGAVVVTCTTSPADASLLGGQWLSLEQGRLRAQERSTPRLGAGPWQQVLVETPDARTLAQLLLDSPHGVTTELVSPDALHVIGPALDTTVQALLELARRHGLELRRIEAAVPPVEALLAARAGFARAAYEASRAAALGAAINHPPAPAPSGPEAT